MTCKEYNNSNSNNSNICFPLSTLNFPKDKSSFRFLTTSIKNHIYTHCANGQPEQEEEEHNCKTKRDSKLCNLRAFLSKRTEFPKRTMISGRPIFYSPTPLPFPSFALASILLPQGLLFLLSPIFPKSKIAATPIRPRARFHQPNIRLQCRLLRT